MSKLPSRLPSYVSVAVAWTLPLNVAEAHKWSSVGTGAWVKVAEVKLKVAGTIKTFFNLKTNDATKFGKGRVYRNGVGVGILRTTKSLTYVFFSEDIAGWSVDDLLQFYIADEGFGKRGLSNIFQIGQGATGETQLT